MENNERGLTLVEILAGIVLLSLITTLATIILSQVFKEDATATEKISLKQNANLLMAALHDDFHNSPDNDLCLEPPTGLVVDETQSTITNGISNNKLKDGCVHSIDKGKPLKVKLLVKDTNDQETMTLQTTLIKGGQETLVLKNSEEDRIPCLAKPPADWVKFPNNALPCEAAGNFVWSGNKTSCKGPAKIKGNLFVTGELKKENFILEINGDSFFQDEVKLQKNSRLTAIGTGCFKDETEIKESSTIDIGSNAEFRDDVHIEKGIANIGHNNASVLFKGESDFDKSNVTVGKETVFRDEFDFDGDSNKTHYSFTALGNIEFRDDFEFEDGTFTMNGQAIFHDETDFKNSKGTITSNTSFHDETELDNSEFTVNGNLVSDGKELELKNNSLLKVFGNAQIKNELKISNSSKLCLKNNIQTSSSGCSY